MTEPAPDARLAATVILMRDQPAAAPEILMMQRADTMVFAAGALVFPGGAIDSQDEVLARSMARHLSVDEATARIAAIRETLEESGIGIGFPDGFLAADLGAMRAALHDGAPLADLLAGHGVTLDLDTLVPFARWHPGPMERARRVYDTRFYLARAPHGQDATPDTNETVHLFWRDARATIAACDAGEGRIIFPTRRNLERLAQFDHFEAAQAQAAAIPIEKVTPWFEERGGVRHLCIPAHLGYPVTSEPMVRVDRR
jgi:8-oxo-dGTP pyrophosphatase MutT (NUDIX family)